MPRPTWQLKIYDTDDALTHTITSDLLFATFTDTCTTDVGSFNFKLPAIKGHSNIYDDIGNHYKVEIYPGYADTYTHLFTGRINDFQTQVTNEAVRVFEGKGLGELLEQRLKKNRQWLEVEADDIVAELADANNLNLTTDLATDTTLETLTVATETYFDVLRKVSDYWFDATHQVKKDFGINKDGELFWKTRPFRTVGVESIADILAYNLKYSIINSKNNIQVQGNASAPIPVDYDEWTDNLDNWAAITGTMSLDGTSPKEGTYWIVCTTAAGGKEAETLLTFPTPINLRTINKLSFWAGVSAPVNTTHEIRLYCPDSSNYYKYVVGWGAAVFYSLALGDSNVYDADENPTGQWIKVGSPNWWEISAINFHYKDTVLINWTCFFDKLFFYPNRWQHTTNAEDATNQAAYGEREAEYTDDTLYSMAQCQKRQETLLYQQKDRVLRLDFTVPGNVNILLGDRIPITLPLDNLTAQNFDVVSVTHTFNKKPEGYQTTAHTLNTANTRRLPPLTPLESIRLNLKGTRDVVSDIYNKVVK